MGMELTRDDVRVELDELGEGLYGEFDENDPSDIPLLRLSVSVRGKLRTWYEEKYGQVLDGDDVWGELPKGSYCTAMSANTTEDLQAFFLKHAMNQLYQLVLIDQYKSVLKQLTWAEPILKAK